MNFKSLLRNQKLLTILHNTLVNNITKNKVSNVSIGGESYAYNQYSLLIVMDLVIKYQIIINDGTYHPYFLKRLEEITSSYKDHQDLVIKGNNLLIDTVASKLNMTVITTREDKQKLLSYIYDKYIVNGYCFHSFPSVFKKNVEEIGLTGEIDYKELSDLKRINYIFANHNYKDIISRDLTIRNKPIYITDSPAMAYYYAFRSPEYLAELTSLSKYYKNIQYYDKNAFYEKNYHACKSNLVSLCTHVNMTVKEENTVLKSFDKRWHSLNMSNSTPCIAFIKRSDLAKDSLPNIDDILANVDKIDLLYLVSKITDSKYPIIRRYSDINSLYLSVITMPSYTEIKNNRFMTLEKSKTKVTTNLKTKKTYQNNNQEEIKPSIKLSYNYGNANIVALLGLLLISLGLTLSIILKVIGG